MYVGEARALARGDKFAHFSTMKKILVTGGAGFIGSNLCEALLERGYSVVCLDNFATGHIENVLGFGERYGERWKLKVGDIRRLKDCREAMEGVEAVFHEAALGSVPRSIVDPVATSTTNIEGFLNVLVTAREAGVKRVVFAASSSTYGDSTELPKREEKIGKPLSPYALTKLVDELYADVFVRCYGDIEYIGLRYFNVFGRRQDPHGAYAAVIPIWVKALMEHRSPLVNGDGSISRDFTPVANVVDVNLLALETTKAEAVNQVYNVACGERTTLKELLEGLKGELSEYDPEIAKVKETYGPPRKGDIPHSLASIDKARTLLGYDPRLNVKEGLREACRWYWENL